MATVTGLTAERMLQIEAASVVDGDVVNGNLILTKHDGNTINAGSVIGPPGPVGPQGYGAIPGEVRMWAGNALPAQATFGKWVWADGGVYAVATYPIASQHTAPEWRTFGGASDPGGGNFRVPDLRGLTPAGLDAMPGGARANRMTRQVAIVIAGRTGEEIHTITVAEMPNHGHGVNDPQHAHAVYDPGHGHWIDAFEHMYQGGGDQSTHDFGSNPNYENSGYAKPATTGIGIYPAATGISIQGNGGGQSHENVQPTVFIPYIVCMHG